MRLQGASVGLRCEHRPAARVEDAAKVRILRQHVLNELNGFIRIVVARKRRARDFGEAAADGRLEALDAVVEIVGRQTAGDDRVRATVGQRRFERFAALRAAVEVIRADERRAFRVRRVGVEGDDRDALGLRRGDRRGDRLGIVGRDRDARDAFGDQIAYDLRLLGLVGLGRPREEARHV